MALPRRSFLQSGASVLLPGAGATLAARAPTSAIRDSSFDPWIEVSPANLRHNVAQVAARVAPRPILAVIKNNGYGLGVANVGRVLEPVRSVHGFAVVKLAEALTLREAGVRKPILLMGPFDEAALDEAVARDITPMVYTPIGDMLERVAQRHGRTIPLHVCVDTGIGRVGVPHETAAPLIRDLALRRSLRIEGVMMTFAEDPDFDREQLGRFETLCRSLVAEGVAIGKRHAASSFALFQNEAAFLDMVRPGMALFGCYSEAPFRALGVLDLRPAVSLKARVAYVKPLRAGQSAGYNRAYIAKRDVFVALCPWATPTACRAWPRRAGASASVASSIRSSLRCRPATPSWSSDPSPGWPWAMWPRSSMRRTGLVPTIWPRPAAARCTTSPCT